MTTELTDDQVRLVSILDEGDDLQTKPLMVSRCHRYTITQEDTVTPTSTYIAVSYVWGLKRSAIICDDVEIEVSSNLVPALRRMKKQFPGKLFWTDSICINQSEAKEKAHQVGMMGRIFAEAEMVVVWFGNDSEEVYDSLHDPALMRQDDTAASEARTKLIKRIANHPWFYRAWTFQEIRLARSSVILFGSKPLPWEQFVIKLREIRSLEPKLSTVEIRSQPWSYSQFPYQPKDQFFGTLDELNNGASSDLAKLLFVTWYRESSLKHDKVYSLLNGALLDGQNHGIDVDYQIRWSQLCVKAARTAINTSSNLKILKIAGMKQRWKSPVDNKWDSNELNQLLTHPSWAPNWWEPPQQLRSSNSLAFDDRGCFSALAFCCPDAAPIQSRDDISPFLALKGVVLGIINTGEPPSWAGGPIMVHAPPLCAAGYPEEWLQKPESCKLGSALQGIRRVSLPAFVEGVQNHLHGMCSCIPYSQRRAQHPDHSLRLGGRIPRDTGLRFNDMHFSLTYQNTGASNNITETAEESHPAQVLATSVESGDWLVLLEGGGMPFVLRPVIDCAGRAQIPEGLMSSGERTKLKFPDGSGSFVLVGEASMCWDRLWPGMWDMYCRAGNFVIV